MSSDSASSRAPFAFAKDSDRNRIGTPECGRRMRRHQRSTRLPQCRLKRPGGILRHSRRHQAWVATREMERPERGLATLPDASRQCVVQYKRMVTLANQGERSLEVVNRRNSVIMRFCYGSFAFMLMFVSVALAQPAKSTKVKPKENAGISAPAQLYLAEKPSDEAIFASEHIRAVQEKFSESVNFISTIYHSLAKVTPGNREAFTELQDEINHQVKLSGQLKTALEVAHLMYENADACTEIYHTTIDVKVSDLTVKQTELVKGCQSLDSYPPWK